MAADSDFLVTDSDCTRSEEVKHVWYFDLDLEHVAFISHESPSNKAQWLCCDQSDSEVC